MTESEPHFEEYQFLGYNRFGSSRRLIVALFCFIFYFFSDSADPLDISVNLFFYLGIIVLIITFVAMFIPHTRIRSDGSTLKIIGPISYRKVNIELKGAKDIEVIDYSRFLLNRPVFNLHWKNVIRFYTYGKKAVQFTTADGDVYKIGTQRPEALAGYIRKYA